MAVDTKPTRLQMLSVYKVERMSDCGSGTERQVTVKENDGHPVGTFANGGVDGKIGESRKCLK